MTVNTSGSNKLKSVQYIKLSLRIPPVLCMVTNSLTDNRWTTRFHSPFPQFTLSVLAQISLMEESSIWRENIFSREWARRATAQNSSERGQEEESYWMHATRLKHCQDRML
jgi:hypothetical protein